MRTSSAEADNSFEKGDLLIFDIAGVECSRHTVHLVAWRWWRRSCSLQGCRKCRGVESEAMPKEVRRAGWLGLSAQEAGGWVITGGRAQK